jgi:hypothetical protein
MSSSDQRLETWRQLLADQQSSGLSVTNWCYKHNIAFATYYYWRKRVITQASTPDAPQWLSVKVPDTCDPLTLRIGRVSIEVAIGFDPRLLHEVLTVLESR